MSGSSELRLSAGVDIYRVRVRISVVLLVAAVMASIAAAAIRISDAIGDHRESVQKQVRVYGTTTALAAETLAKLKQPPGFKRSSQCFLGPEAVCFTRNKSLLLSTHVVARLLAATGATLYSAEREKYGVPPIGCRTATLHIPLSFQACDAEALIGDERLAVSVISAVQVIHGSPRQTTRSLKGYAHPVEVQVQDLGHDLHGATP
jgi:hypothetical protein